MSLESEFAAEIAKTYERGGWAVAAPEDAVQQINFQPDLLLKKGDQHLVIEIKREGFVGSRATELMKKIVEMDKNWKFEMKVIPREWGIKNIEIGSGDVDTRVRIAKKLREDGHASEAFILFWTAIEAALRLLLDIDPKRTVESSTLVREAYEEGVIVDAELRELQAALHSRDQLVHGLRVEINGDGGKTIADLAESLSSRLQPGGAPVS